MICASITTRFIKYIVMKMANFLLIYSNLFPFSQACRYIIHVLTEKASSLCAYLGENVLLWGDSLVRKWAEVFVRLPGLTRPYTTLIWNPWSNFTSEMPVLLRYPLIRKVGQWNANMLAGAWSTGHRDYFRTSFFILSHSTLWNHRWLIRL